jgi:hypothetical protein
MFGPEARGDQKERFSSRMVPFPPRLGSYVISRRTIMNNAGKSSLNQVRMAIDTADSPTAQTKAKAIHEKSLAASREIERALGKIG